MKRKHLVVTAIGLALLSGLFLLLYSRELERRYGYDSQQVSVLTATKSLSRGTRLEPNLLTAQSLPARYASPRAVPAKELNTILSSRLAVNLRAGEPVLWSDLDSAQLEAEGLAPLIPVGERALPLPVGDTGGMGRLLKPNDHVDILGTFTEAAEGSTTLTLLQNVTVLAVGNQVGAAQSEAVGQAKGSKSGNVTVAVTPEEAEMLVHAMDRGRLSLTLRSPDDLKSLEPIADRTFSSLFQPETRKKIQAQRDKQIEIITPKRR